MSVKKCFFWAGAMILMFTLSVVHARDEYKMRPIEAALKSDEAKKRLNPGIKLFFGRQTSPQAEKRMGDFATKRSTTHSESEDYDPCVHVFVVALSDLQGKARLLGGNAVVNIRSNYKNNEVFSETEYTCVSGSLVTAVALKGDIVKLAE